MPAYAGEYENKIVTTIDAMKTKVKFVKPAILREVSLESEGQILAGSVVDGMTVTAIGQDVDEYDFSPENDGGFNFEWGEE